jgi:hypothetical protein
LRLLLADGGHHFPRNLESLLGIAISADGLDTIKMSAACPDGAAVFDDPCSYARGHNANKNLIADAEYFR